MRTIGFAALNLLFSAVSTFSQESPKPIDETPPQVFHADIGNVFGEKIEIDLQNSVLICRTKSIDGPLKTKTVQPSRVDWMRFVQGLNECQMYLWAPHYIDENVVDGGEWRIRLKIGKRRFYSEGINAFPRENAIYLPRDAERGSPGQVFSIFWRALCQLVREDPAAFPLK